MDFFSNISPVGIISFVLVLAGLISFHELGHFLAARLMGIGVRTFSIGFGKPLISWQGKNTRYQISAIPLGGYVDLVGMQKDEEITAPFTKADSYNSRGPAARLFTVMAGPVFNIVLAWFIYWGLMLAGTTLLMPEVGSLKNNSPAMAAGIEPGDKITVINGNTINYWDDVLYNVQAAKGEALEVSVVRNGQNYSFNIIPEALKYTDDKGKEQTFYLMGIVASGNFIKLGFFEAGVESFKTAWSKTLLIVNLVAQLFTSEESITDNLGGPVMVAQTVHNQAKNGGLQAVLTLTAILSINLGLLNLLPIPALDGGHVLFNLIELVFRRPVPEAIQARAAQGGFIFLISLMLMATVLDVFRIAN